MRYSDLEEFCALVRYETFSSAAKELNMSRSALSEHIAAMEKELGSPLVIRGSNITLTEKGTMFLDHARRVLRDYDRVLGAFRAQKRLRIIARPTEAITAFMSQFDSGVVSIIDYDYNSPLFEKLERRNADVLVTWRVGAFPGLLQEITRLGLKHRDMKTPAPHALMLSKENPLSQHSSLSREDLDGCTLSIGSAVQFERTVQFAKSFLTEACDVRFDYKSLGSLTSYQFAPLGDSILICPAEVALMRQRAQGDVKVFLELDGEKIANEQSAVYVPDEENEILQKFLETFTKPL